MTGLPSPSRKPNSSPASRAAPVLSDNAMSVLVPVLEEVLRWDSVKIRRYFTANGLMLREWDKTRTDMLTIQESTNR